MKKFLSKKPVMITFVVVAVLMIALYIGILVRPVAIGLNYTHKEDGMAMTYSFGFKKVKATISTKNNKETDEVYYYCKDNIVVFDYLGVVENNDDYNEWKKEIKENWDVYKKTGIKINAFELGVGEENTLKCTGTIVFAVVNGILTVAVTTFAALSVVFFIKKKKA